jgi:hypothetical protein
LQIANIDEPVKSRQIPFFVIPAEAGIQLFQNVVDSGFRRGDDPIDFLRNHRFSCGQDYKRKSVTGLKTG